jgi:NAD-reducing hydrogenase large subunit
LKAVNLRRYGQQIIERLGGKRVHPNFAVPGGVNAPLSPKDRESIAAELKPAVEIAKVAVGIGKGWLEANKDLASSFASFPSNYMGLVDMEGGLQLYDGEIRVKDAHGKFVAQFKPEHYLSHVAEHVESWSFLKFPYYRKLGWPGGMYRVGPLGRLNVADKIGTPMANEEFKLFKQINGGKPVEGSLFYHYARLIELVYALERIGQLLDDREFFPPTLISPCEIPGQGWGVKLPRTLFHDYSTNENGQLTRVNLIVATGNNNWAMHTSAWWPGPLWTNSLTEGVLNRVEAAIAAALPVLRHHAMGKMPLESPWWRRTARPGSHSRSDENRISLSPAGEPAVSPAGYFCAPITGKSIRFFFTSFRRKPESSVFALTN